MTLNQDDLSEAAEFLLQYLKSIGALESFIHNAVGYGSKSELIRKLQNITDPYNIIDNSFIWMDTQEEHQYWMQIAEDIDSTWKRREINEMIF